MIRVLIGALILSLVIWVSFYYLGWPLLPSETAVVTGFCLLLVFAIDRLIRLLRRKTPPSPGQGSQPVKNSTKDPIIKSLIFVPIFFAAIMCSASESHLCTIDKPTAEPTDSVGLAILAAPGDSPSDHYEWSVTVGRLDEVGPVTNWLLSDAPVGQYTATLNVIRDSTRQPLCSVRLYVIQPVRGTTSRGLLVRGKQAPTGYGMYSYLLFSSPPDADSYDRYIKMIEVYLRLSPSLEQMEDVVSKDQINLNCVPVVSSPMGDIDPDWILKHYDYARARAFLNSIGGTYFAGPYLLSASHQTVDEKSLTKPYIFEDLSVIPPHLIAAWYEHFLNEAAQRDFSTAAGVEDLALRARTLIAVLAIALPDVRMELDKWIQFAH